MQAGGGQIAACKSVHPKMMLWELLEIKKGATVLDEELAIIVVVFAHAFLGFMG